MDTRGPDHPCHFWHRSGERAGRRRISPKSATRDKGACQSVAADAVAGRLDCIYRLRPQATGHGGAAGYRTTARIAQQRAGRPLGGRSTRLLLGRRHVGDHIRPRKGGRYRRTGTSGNRRERGELCCAGLGLIDGSVSIRPGTDGKFFPQSLLRKPQRSGTEGGCSSRRLCRYGILA